MRLEFAKMHGLGNHFMVVDLVTQQCDISEALVKRWSDPATGIGFDQLLLIEPPTDPEADFRVRIFNTDGSEARQCGNGVRCVARYVHERRLSPKPELLLQTLGAPTRTRRLDATMVEVDMGPPRCAPGDIPMDTAADGLQRLEDTPASYTLDTELGSCEFTTVSMGNPHAVLFVDSAATAPLEQLGPLLVGHPVFPEGANIGFCEVVDKGFLRLRVFERGVGETRACGSGACAAAVAAQLRGRVGARVKVSLPGGKVRIGWQGADSAVRMTGPAALVFEGYIDA